MIINKQGKCEKNNIIKYHDDFRKWTVRKQGENKNHNNSIL